MDKVLIYRPNGSIEIEIEMEDFVILSFMMFIGNMTGVYGNQIPKEEKGYNQIRKFLHFAPNNTSSIISIDSKLQKWRENNVITQTEKGYFINPVIGILLTRLCHELHFGKKFEEVSFAADKQQVGEFVSDCPISEHLTFNNTRYYFMSANNLLPTRGKLVEGEVVPIYETDREEWGRIVDELTKKSQGYRLECSVE